LAIGIAPFVANAPDGLYQLLQQLNGIFFIPIATVILAGFLIPSVSAEGAKAGLLFGLFFYIIMNFIVEINLHFVHIWGMEFVLNLLVMMMVSSFYPIQSRFEIKDVGAVDMQPWSLAKPMAVGLTIVTVIVYLFLG
jgi:SSS family solute:Na+ symporter